MHLSNSGSFSCLPPPPWPKSGLGTCFFEFLILELVYLPIFIRIARDLLRKSEVVFNLFSGIFFERDTEARSSDFWMIQKLLNDPYQGSVEQVWESSEHSLPRTIFFVRNLWGWSWLKLFLLSHFLGIRFFWLSFFREKFLLHLKLCFSLFLLLFRFLP